MIKKHPSLIGNIGQRTLDSIVAGGCNVRRSIRRIHATNSRDTHAEDEFTMRVGNRVSTRPWAVHRALDQGLFANIGIHQFEVKESRQAA
jgi:hypothetical protein